MGLGIMGVVACAFGRLTRTEWVWWLAPLTVALEGSLPFRTPLLSPSGLHIYSDTTASIYFVSSVVAAGVAAWGAYTGNRLGIIIGAAVAILGSAVDRSDGEKP